MHSHRASSLKQQNKQHKTGRHKSNRSLDNISKGKVQLKALTRRKQHDQKRHERRLQARQIRANKRQEALNRRRALGTASTPPFLVALVPLHGGASAREALALLTAAEADLTVTQSPQGVTHISVGRLRRRLAVISPPGGDLYATLDAVKVADCVLFLLGPDGADEEGTRILSAVFAHGVSSTMLAVLGLQHATPKRQSEAKKQIQKQLERWFGSQDGRLHVLAAPSDASALLHHVTNGKLRPVTFRERRPHLLAERLQFEPDPEQQVSGYLRGRRPLSASRLVHVCGWGDYQLSEITGPADPHPLAGRSRATAAADQAMADAEERVLSRADPAIQESLQAENMPDEQMDGDEPWPDDDALRDAETLNRVARRKRVPRGTSEYQAAWIVDSDGEADQPDDADSDGMSCDDADEAAAPAAADDDEDSASDDGDGGASVAPTESEAAVDDDKYDRDMDLDEEATTLKKIREAREDEQFPDEVDTPKEVPARVRFQKYRGLASFRASPWDPKENLPADYARCFQFANFERTRRLALAEEPEGAQPGQYVSLRLLNVPSYLWSSRDPAAPLVVFGLLAHEQKMSVLNCVIQRHASGHQRPIRAKERLVFHVGFRRFAAAPVFSQHTNGDKHKMERFFRADSAVVATMFAPIVYGPAPVLVMQEDRDGSQDLVATGSVLSVNPDRIVTKRVVLSGHPFKINKRSAVARYMFFNREDIMWFKPIELRTKYGRRGNIKEPLGTHGHMKVVFNGPLNSQDTILMMLYKRMFPKWTYDPCVAAPPALYNPERAAPLPPLPEEADDDMVDT
ncbi:pre-rRNA-processing protein TSR1 homolog [Pollicipes pollicipes]|uniref:pre-rRNA-processing protein TSR1 homolog n=1 Tax=Pollicipes pollicipes TaxID=41117 RepID=UPI001885796F|nr:pre-rRNA-processing protein TSR1 homolog [Pollicipes pollicipes]